MTIPIVTVVRTDEQNTTLSRAVTVAYYLPTVHQNDPPQPHDPEIVIEQWPATIVYTRWERIIKQSGNDFTFNMIHVTSTHTCDFRAFTGATNELSIIHEISSLAEALDSPALCVNDSFIVAGYTNPAAANRQNEIWFLERP